MDIKLACYVLSVAGNAFEHPWYALSGGLQIARLVCQPSVAVVLLTCLGSAAIWGIESRYLATIGYMSIAAGWYEFANAMLTFHYGLMSFDAEDTSVTTALTNGGLALAYSAENFRCEQE